MGASQSYQSAQVQPVPQGLAAFEGNGSPHTYCAKSEMTLHVREKVSIPMVSSGDSFTVTDRKTGQVWFKMRGKVMTLSQRKQMEDAAGAPVFEMRHKPSFMTMHNTITVTRPGSGTLAIEAKQDITFVQAYKRCTIRASVHDIISGRPVYLTLLGDVRGKAGVILLGDESSRHVIAKMYKPTNAMHLLMDAQEYEVTVAAGVDTALISAMCVIWDECAHDGN